MKPFASLVACGLLFICVNTAAAHGIGAEATLKDGKVHISAFFDDDTPARDAKTEVTDDRGQAIAEGRTDDLGRWAFPVPPAGKYHLVVDAGAGHRAKLTVTIPSDAGDAKHLSDGASRDEFTRMPWERLAIGVGAILLIGFALPWMLKQAKKGRSSIS